MAAQAPVSPARAREALCLVVLLDMVGFSILFPLFPSLLDFYLGGAERPSGPLGDLLVWAQSFAPEDQRVFATQVLFGGLLGSLASLVQFVAAPLWGRFSDTRGRRAVLLWTTGGQIASHLLWLFSGSFVLFLIARLLSGMMAGNIAVATAAVADVTKPQERTKGMALIGMAFALGFILGPLIGATASLWDPQAAGLPGALHPFVLPALLSLLLAVLNFFWVLRAVPETLPQRDPSEPEPQRRRAWWGLPGGAVRSAIRLQLLFMLAFAGMEFTLAFLAVERLGFSPGQLGWMFAYLALLLALTQGVFVRRYSGRIGENALLPAGLLLCLLGLVVLSVSAEAPLFFTGLACVSVGMGLVSPSLTALVSRYSEPRHQGMSLGAFRSAGALGRAIGPLIAAVLYWQIGSELTYLGAAGLVLITVLLALLLPKPPPVPPEAAPRA